MNEEVHVLTDRTLQRGTGNSDYMCEPVHLVTSIPTRICKRHLEFFSLVLVSIRSVSNIEGFLCRISTWSSLVHGQSTINQLCYPN